MFDNVGGGYFGCNTSFMGSGRGSVGRCSDVSIRRDCDGDTMAVCCSSDSCPYQRNVRDCDGDIITLCCRY